MPTEPGGAISLLAFSDDVPPEPGVATQAQPYHDFFIECQLHAEAKSNSQTILPIFQIGSLDRFPKRDLTVARLLTDFFKMKNQRVRSDHHQSGCTQLIGTRGALLRWVWERFT
jgi:hypothetical protein